ncbi:MAG: DUF4349 domain-containing protein [Candidatus Limnocylindria bacterium]
MHATRLPRVAALGATVLLAGLVAACSGGAVAMPIGAGSGAPEAAALGSDTDEGQRGIAEGNDSANGGAIADLALNLERRIIQIGEVSIEVEDVEATLTEVRAVASALGGYVAATEASDVADSGASLTLRIPAEQFDEALGRLHDVGEVLHESTHEEDVTSAIVDLEARIENLRASEVTYRSLLERATDIEDILAVQSRLDEVRSQIEQLDAQAQSLSGQADLSTLTVRLVPQPLPVEESTEGWNPGESAEQAVAALLTLGRGLLTALIWIAIVLLPLGIVFGVAALLVLRLTGVFRRRTVEQPPA